MSFRISNIDGRMAQVKRGAILTMFLALAFSVRPAMAQLMDPTQDIAVRPELLKDVSIEQKLDQSVPLDLKFADEQGQTVTLGEYFRSGKPVVLSLVYFSCPMLCTEELNGINRSLKEIPMSIGKDFEVVTVSIDPTDTPKLAGAKRDLYAGMYGRPGAAQGWHFLTGENSQIKRLADSVGYHYAFDAQSGQFAHAAAAIVLTGDGKISRYFYGVTYPSRDLRFGLEQASDGKIGSPVDQVLLFCYHYDPHTGKYGLIISRVIQISGAATLLGIAAFIFMLSRGPRFSVPSGGHG